MRTFLTGLLVALAALAFAPAARADESAITLKPGDNLEVVEQNCAACHSLDYIQMNSRFLDKAGWTASINKMINAFGAPIPKEDVDTIANYLAQNYGVPPKEGAAK